MTPQRPQHEVQGQGCNTVGFDGIEATLARWHPCHTLRRSEKQQPHLLAAPSAQARRISRLTYCGVQRTQSLSEAPSIDHIAPGQHRQALNLLWRQRTFDHGGTAHDE
jgi:hypothetical protein